MTEVEEGVLEVVGILNGGGINCEELGDENYQPTTNGRWMRVLKFEKWVHETIFNELLPGRKILFKKKTFHNSR